jgi:hypothetical protein
LSEPFQNPIGKWEKQVKSIPIAHIYTLTLLAWYMHFNKNTGITSVSSFIADVCSYVYYDIKPVYSFKV